MVELKALNLHWLENMAEEIDKCAHSSVYLKIGDKVVSNELSGDWTVSSSAYYFLKSFKDNHNKDSSSQLLPCCGFSMYLVGYNNDELLIFGCPSGIDWTISHKHEKVIHQFEDGETVETDFDEWRNAVCKFSDEIMNFYKISAPKVIENEEDKKTFEFFMNEWKKLRTAAFD